jgi:hypothetical protein
MFKHITVYIIKYEWKLPKNWYTDVTISPKGMSYIVTKPPSHAIFKEEQSISW